MKESQRLSPNSLISQNRKITAPRGLVLSNGMYLPQGTYVSVPSAQIAMDPILYDKPEQFHGLRFYRLRQRSGHNNKHQFVSTSQQSLVFGQGKHSCPGRFFASNEIKIFMLWMLLHYDLRLPPGIIERPKNIMRGLACIPPQDTFELRARTPELKLTAAITEIEDNKRKREPGAH